MNTYNLIQVEETTIANSEIGYGTTTFTVPVDNNGNAVTDYLSKNRIIKDGQMFVFDNEQEYRDWLNQNI